MAKLKYCFLCFLGLVFFSYTTLAQKEMPKKAVLSKKIQSAPAPTHYKNLNITQFIKKMGNKDVVILDVRTAPEIEQGKIKDAVEINVLDASFAEKIKKLDKGKIYLVYCKSGGRSVRACNVLSNAGFKNLYNLPGGYTKWVMEGNAQ